MISDAEILRASRDVSRIERYLSQLLSTDAGAKELRVFGLSRHLLGRYRAILERQEREIGVVAQRRAVLGLITGLLPLAAYAILALSYCLPPRK